MKQTMKKEYKLNKPQRLDLTFIEMVDWVNVEREKKQRKPLSYRAVTRLLIKHSSCQLFSRDLVKYNE